MSGRTRTLTAARLLLVVAFLAGCTEGPRFLREESTCPGPTCTDDARERLAAIRALPGVDDAARVWRSSRADRGSSSAALVTARVATAAQAREVGLEVLGVLADWPGHDAATALATVEADPPVGLEGAARETEVLSPAFYDPCSPRECAAALTDLEERLETDHDGVDVTTGVRDGQLVVTGTAPREEAALAARAAVRVLRDTGLRVAAVAEVTLRWRAPLSLTLRLEEGRVCEQPAGAVVACDETNSSPFDE